MTGGRLGVAAVLALVVIVLIVLVIGFDLTAETLGDRFTGIGFVAGVDVAARMERVDHALVPAAVQIRRVERFRMLTSRDEFVAGVFHLTSPIVRRRPIFIARTAAAATATSAARSFRR